MSYLCLHASFCPRETMIQWKPEFSTLKWILPLLPSNRGSRKLRLFRRKCHISENLCAHCRMEALWSIHKMTPVCTTPASVSVCHHQKKCWVSTSTWTLILILTNLAWAPEAGALTIGFRSSIMDHIPQVQTDNKVHCKIAYVLKILNENKPMKEKTAKTSCTLSLCIT